MTTETTSSRPRKRFLAAPASLAFTGITFPRVGPLKYGEFFGLLGLPAALGNKRIFPILLKSHGAFLAMSVISFVIAYLQIGSGDNTLASEKGLYSRPEYIPLVGLIRLLVYFATLATAIHFFTRATPHQIKRAIAIAYYVAIAPGALQLVRIYSGIHFDTPFEREGLGPFSGVFDAGYLRIMGFEYEPLSYATSLVALSCVYIHAHRKLPILGLVMLYHTYGAGAAGGFAIAAVVTQIRVLRLHFALIYTVAAALICGSVAYFYMDLVEVFLLFQSAMERINAVNACVAMALDRPWGIGLGMYGYYFNIYNPLRLWPNISLDFYPNNDFAMFLAYGGPLYALAYMWVFQVAIRKSRSTWLSIAVIAILIQSFTSYLFFNPAIVLVLSLILSGSPAKAPAPSARATGPWRAMRRRMAFFGKPARRRPPVTAVNAIASVQPGR